MPGSLSAADAQAIGTVGTSTIDLDAAALGIAARTGIRYTLTQPPGVTGVSVSLRGGVGYEPESTGSSIVSWRGTTLRGGVGVTRNSDNTMVGRSVEVTRSVTDSLGGRNQYPGGGSLNAAARLLHFVGAAGRGLVALNGLFARPLAIERADVATRLIPIGDFMGATASCAVYVCAAAATWRRIVPRGSLPIVPTSVTAKWISFSAGRAAAVRRSPATVSCTLLLVRCTSGTQSRSSRRRIA